MAPEPWRNEVKAEENLLLDAVSLLAQRQRDTESWVAEQVWQAEERVAATERRQTELQARLDAIEQRLASLAREFEPARIGAADNERLTRLREQLEELRSGADGYVPRSSTAPAPAAREPRVSGPDTMRTTSRATAPQSPGILELAEPMSRDRLGFVFMALGGVAVLYAILSQLRFG